MSGVPTPEDASTTILPNTRIHLSVVSVSAAYALETVQSRENYIFK